jgi:dimethylargininase
MVSTATTVPATRRTIAIVKRPAPSLAEHCELTYIEREPMSFALLESQHRAYRDALAAAGAEVVDLDADGALPDSVFIEDAAVVLDELALLTRPGTPTRRAEPERVAAELSKRRRRHERIQAPGTLEGGDVLRIGRRVFVGSSTRTDRAGIEQFAGIVHRYGYKAIHVEVRGSLHLKTACTALDDETLLLNPAWLDAAAFEGFDTIAVADDEPFAANVLRIGATLIANAAFPHTLERVRAHAQRTGQRVLHVDISEFGKAEAGLTCMSLVFDAGTNARIECEVEAR